MCVCVCFLLFFLPKLKGDQNRNGRSKNIREYQKHGGGGGGGEGGLKLKGDQNRKGRSKNIREYQEH